MAAIVSEQYEQNKHHRLPTLYTAEQSFSLWTSWLKGVNAEQRETNTGGAEVTWLTNGEAQNSRIDPEEHFVLALV